MRSLIKLTLIFTLINGYAYQSFAKEIKEAPSTVNATYVEASATKALKPGEKIANLYTKNANEDYVLQRLTERIYWVQSQFYGTIFYVGDKGVLIFDALEGRTKQIKAAISEVTDLPITALLYSHNHADHIVDAKIMLNENPNLKIFATRRTANQMKKLKSTHPKPTNIVKNSFKFEDLVVNVIALEDSSHAHDHSIYELKGTGVIHVPDIINPDQPPFWSFAGADTYLGYRDMINKIESLDWIYLSGGHGNVGSRDDVVFYQKFLDDLEAAVSRAMSEVPWGAGVKNPETLNAHTAFLSGWINEIGKRSTEILRPKYGDFYGFEYSTPKNSEMVAMKLFSYR